MIIDKQPLPGDEVDSFQDAPPSYDALEGVPPSIPPRDEKAGPSNRALPPLPPPVSPSSPTATLSFVGNRTSKQSPAAWFNFGPSSRAVREIRSTLLLLLHDLVKQGDARGAHGVLESCADACKTYDLSLSSLLQEPSVGGHTPIYWAIIKRSTVLSPDDSDLVSALLKRAGPLSEATMDELRLACLQTSDQELFQRLRRMPAFSPLTSKDEIILGDGVTSDDVEVENVKEDKNAFIMKVRIPMFQKRVMISGTVHVEFIAKGRLWELSFLVAKDFDKRLAFKPVKSGSWVVKLALLPHSPPTWVDSRLVIEDPRARAGSPLKRVSSASAAGPSASTSMSLIGAVRDKYAFAQLPRLEPRVELRLRARDQLTAHTWSKNVGSMIVVPLGENEHANSLQFKDCPYLESDGSLEARLEARLAPPDTDCVIC